MKTVTRERILRSLEKLNAHKEERLDHLGVVICSFANLGLRTYCDVASETDAQKVGLEMTLIGQPQREIDLRLAHLEWREMITRRNSFRDAIYSIAENAGISGLDSGFLSVGGIDVEVKTPSELLPLIRSDVQELQKSKPIIVDYLLRFYQENPQHKWYKFDNGKDWPWIESSLNEVMAAIPFFDMASSWHSCDRERHLCFYDLTETLDFESRECPQTWFCLAGRMPHG